MEGSRASGSSSGRVEPLGWGIIGPGTIARSFAANLARTQSGRLVAVGTRNPGREGLGTAFPGARILDGYEALLADPEVQAIYIATPHPFHAEWAIRAAEAGRHVLCEKPMGVSAAEAEAMIHAARKAGTFLGEAFMYRHHPQTAKLTGLVRDGAIGTVRMVKASFGFAMGNPDPQHRLLANRTGGGAILDIACYPVSMARLIAGAAEGKPFLEPRRLFGVGRLGETGADGWASAVLEFPNGILAEVSGSILLAQDNMVRVYGTEGWLEVRSPWFATGKEGGPADIVIHRPGAGPETVRSEEPAWLYTFEIDDAADAIRAGRQEFRSPGMTWADTLGNMKALDRWRASIGLEYGFEKPENRPKTTIGGRPLTRTAAPMRRRKLAGIDREVSVIALGCANIETHVQFEIIFDAFYERGGNLIDTAWVYLQGRADRIMGDWLASRGVRDEMVIIGKGAHTPLVYPDVIGRQLTQSLEKLRTDRIDIYLMHRDNPEVPVGEFVDAMDAEARAGRIGMFGGSNWSRERMDAAIEHAERNGRQKPGALSNNFSLATMANPVWPGVLSASDAGWKAWLRSRQIPLFAWSSQARGFFTDRAARDRRDDPELVNAWYSEENFARRDRAAELARRFGKRPLHVALAYCLHQDFPVLPIIGPLALAELEDSLEALDIELTAEQVRWLEEGDGKAP